MKRPLFLSPKKAAKVHAAGANCGTGAPITLEGGEWCSDAFSVDAQAAMEAYEGIMNTTHAIRKIKLATRLKMSPFLMLEAMKKTAHSMKSSQPHN
jgi:hypothetical protein